MTLLTILKTIEVKKRNHFKSAIISLGVISFTILLAGFLFSNRIARFLGANDVLFSDTSRYIRTIALFVPIISFNILFSFTGRLIEKPHLYLAGTVSCIFSNIILNFIALKILQLGVLGAGVGTGIVYIIGLIVLIRPALSKKTTINIYDGRFCWNEFKHLAFNGSSDFVNDNKAVIDMAVRGAKIYGLCFLLCGFNIIQSGYHTALGNALASILIAASRGIVFVAMGLIVFSIFWGINGVWFTLPFAEIMTFVWGLIILFHQREKGTLYNANT